MQRDSIFFQVFQQFPRLVFELMENPPVNPEGYRFAAEEVKETAFRLDGVLLPPLSSPPGDIYFVEVQLQRDNLFNERLSAETQVYLYRNRPLFTDWRAVVIYLNRATEQALLPAYEAFILNKVDRIYLDELGAVDQLPIGTALVVLTTLENEQQALQTARELLTRTQTEVPLAEQRAMMELISTIMVYKLKNLSREEIEAMLATTIQETRVYQDAKAEGRLEGEHALVLRLLIRKVGELPAAILSQVQGLTLPQIEALGEALLDFSSLNDLQAWLEQQNTGA
jgi:predicted transposase YdaD